MRAKAVHDSRVPIRIDARPAFANAHMNPYNSLLYEAVSVFDGIRVREHKYLMFPWGCDIFHVHWPEVVPKSSRPIAYLRTIIEWSWLLLARAAGVKIVWTAHNSFRHDVRSSPVNVFLWERFLSLLDGVIFLSEESRLSISAQYPQLATLPAATIKHGHYRPWIDRIRRGATAPSPQVRTALEELGEAFTILNFGQLRRYKNIEQLMRQFSLLGDPTVRLIVAGFASASDIDYLSELSTLAEADPRIVLLPVHLDDASLVACLERANLVVLPYRDVLNSGSAILATSFSKHVVVPAIGSMRTLQRDVGRDSLTLYEGPLDVAVLRSAIQRAESANIPSPNLRAYEWPLIAAQTVDFYRRLLHSPSR